MDREAEFAEVYAQYKSIVWGVTSRYFPEKSDREEAFQEAFVRIYRYLPSASREAEDSFKSWIYKVTVSTSINLYNKHKRQNLIGDVLKFTQRFWEKDAPAGSDHEDGFQERLLAPLNATQRAVLLLREVEDLSYDEIAETLSMKVGTVKSTLNRAKQKVRDSAGGNGNDE